MNERRGAGRPRILDGRNPDEQLIRERLSQRTKKAGEIYWLVDEVSKHLGRPISQAYLSQIILGVRRNPKIQRAISRVLGLNYDKAFPKPLKPLPRAKGRLVTDRGKKHG